MLMTMTTSKRFRLFERTIKSLIPLGLDRVITRCVILDDHSEPVDVGAMVKILQQLGIKTECQSGTSETKWRHVAAMNKWLDIVKHEKYVFHCEDDWEFFQQAFGLFSWAITLLEDHEWLGQACFRRVDNRTTTPKPSENFWIRTIANCPEDPNWKAHPGHWPSRFTLTPAITRVESLKTIGQFEEEPGFERVFGLKWVNAGWTTAYHPSGFCTHIGQGQSAYDLNGSVH